MVRYLVLASMLIAGSAYANTADGKLGGEEIRKAVSGKRIYLSVPLGGEIPLFYRPDGRVDGSGEAAGLGRFLRPSDSGRWWVEGNRLCQKWTSWYDGKTFCFTLSRAGSVEAVAWYRDDGASGVARIGN